MPKVANTYDAVLPNQECRICFESFETSTNNLISPCECRGSLRYLHENCMKEWMGRVLKNSSPAQAQQILNKRAINCEICQKEVGFSFSKNCRCKNRSQIKKLFQTQGQKKIVFLLIMLFIIVLLIVTLAQLLKIILSDTQEPALSVIIIFGVLLFSFLIFLTLLIYLIFTQLVMQQIQIDRVQTKYTFLTGIPEFHNEAESNQQMLGQVSRSSMQPALEREHFWVEQ